LSRKVQSGSAVKKTGLNKNAALLVSVARNYVANNQTAKRYAVKNYAATNQVLEKYSDLMGERQKYA
jgi:hypothetical protein